MYKLPVLNKINKFPMYHNDAAKDAFRNLANPKVPPLVVNGYAITITKKEQHASKIKYSIALTTPEKLGTVPEKEIEVSLNKPEKSNNAQLSIFSLNKDANTETEKESDDSKIFKILMDEVLKDKAFQFNESQRKQTIQLLKLYNGNYFVNPASEYISSKSNNKVLLCPNHHKVTIKLNNENNPILHIETYKNTLFSSENKNRLDTLNTYDIYSIDNDGQIKLDESKYTTGSNKTLDSIIDRHSHPNNHPKSLIAIKKYIVSTNSSFFGALFKTALWLLSETFGLSWEPANVKKRYQAKKIETALKIDYTVRLNRELLRIQCNSNSMKEISKHRNPIFDFITTFFHKKGYTFFADRTQTTIEKLLDRAINEAENPNPN